MKSLNYIKSIILSITLFLMLSACSQSGNESATTSGNNGGVALPFAVSALPNPDPLKATLYCPPNGSPVNMEIDQVTNSAKGSCTGLSAGTNQTFTIKLTYGTNNLMLASASKSITVKSGGNNLSFKATEFDSNFDADSDGITNLVEVINGTNPNLSYQLGGTVYGLAPGAGLTLQNNGGNTKTITGNGGTQSFNFDSPIEGAITYHVTSSVPASANQICAINHGDGGAITSDVSDIAVYCIQNTGKKLAGFYSTFYIRPDGTLWAWGDQIHGSLGDGWGDPLNPQDVPQIQAAPKQIGTDNHWASVAVGFGHTLALKTNGTLWSWGYNFNGQLGDGTRDDHNEPRQVGTDSNWVRIAAGSNHSLALRKDDASVTLWTWGTNEYGQLGDGQDPSVEPFYINPEQIGTATNWSDIASSSYHSVALRSDGTLWTWGDNAYGEIGDGQDPTLEPYVVSPKQVGFATDWVSISAARHNTLGLRDDGTNVSLWIWGNNDAGEIGNGTDPSDPSTPIVITTPTLVALPAGTTNWVRAESGGDFTIALAQGSNGTDVNLYAWGDNSAGQLGDPLFTGPWAITPKLVGTFTNWSNIMATRGAYIIAQRADSTLWAWGGNGGSLGDGTLTNRNEPVQIGTPTSFRFHTVGGKVTGLASGDRKPDYHCKWLVCVYIGL